MIVGIVVAFPGRSRAADPPRFEWKDGDRVVLIGDTLIERDQTYGYLETLITAANPDRSISFRNLGWSGDTVRGLSRARFGPPAEGWQHLVDHVNELKPTVLIVGYGMADSFDGEAGLPAFRSGLNSLLDALATPKVRVVLMSPIAHEDLGRPLPDPSRHNKDLLRYTQAIKALARERNAAFVDLFEFTYVAELGRHREKPLVAEPFTDNGIHLTRFGSYALARVTAHALRPDPTGRSGGPVVIENGKVVEARGTKVSHLETTPDGLRFELLDDALPDPLLPPQIKNTYFRRFYVKPLTPGRYVLKADGRPVARADADGWAESVVVSEGPEFDQVEALRRAINAKNELYFYRWRPQNETYLFGFRKHEQGNNAREIPLFDPLVEAKEKEIARLRTPKTHHYELTRESEAAK